MSNRSMKLVLADFPIYVGDPDKQIKTGADRDYTWVNTSKKYPYNSVKRGWKKASPIITLTTS